MDRVGHNTTKRTQFEEHNLRNPIGLADADRYYCGTHFLSPKFQTSKRKVHKAPKYLCGEREDYMVVPTTYETQALYNKVNPLKLDVFQKTIRNKKFDVSFRQDQTSDFSNSG